MAFNITNFASEISASGVMFNNKYEVLIMPPVFMRNSSIGNVYNENETNNLIHMHRFRIQETITPAVELQVVPIARYGVGTMEDQTINAKMPELPISIICDRNGDIPAFWYNWTRGIFEYSSLDGTYNRAARSTAEYKDDYSTTMQLIVYNNSGDNILTYNFYSVYPKAIKEIPLNWSAQNELAKLTIILTYKEFTLYKSQVTDNSNGAIK